MSGHPAGADAPPRRLLGRYDGGRSGASVVAIGGIHGNEPAGLIAAARVLEALERQRPAMTGRFVALAGNLTALARGQRYISRDLNRLWTDEEVARLQAADPATDDVEAREQRVLLALFTRLEAETEDVVYLDLHSTSAPGPPFHCISDTLHTRRIARATPIPLILGIEEAIRGSLLEFMEARGRPLLLIEGGQHADAATVTAHESAIWQALVTAGVLAPGDLSDLPVRRARLAGAAGVLPPVLEVIYRHPVDGDGFRMLPGYRNFDLVARGQLLAETASGYVRAPASGRLLMPLYQDQGEDGFFIARAVRPVWLTVSALLRAVGVDRLLPRLPGVSPVPERPDRFLADRHVARWFTVQLFHLCGYRKIGERGDVLVFTRRVEKR